MFLVGRLNMKLVKTGVLAYFLEGQNYISERHYAILQRFLNVLQHYINSSECYYVAEIEYSPNQIKDPEAFKLPGYLKGVNHFKDLFTETTQPKNMKNIMSIQIVSKLQNTLGYDICSNNVKNSILLYSFRHN